MLAMAEFWRPAGFWEGPARPCGRISRRDLIRLLILAGLAGWLPRRAHAQGASPAFSYPMALPGRPFGDGFLIRHGYATENTWYNPGWWHTGEDWYLADGDTAGVDVYAVAAGEVVFAGSDYPGRVVIVRHDEALFSMYGHLDYALAIAQGQTVERGARLGTVLARTDGQAPSHLHFEMRTFLTTPEVNGNAPRDDVACGYECPPGPGYWPIDAPEHPSAMGWRNPTHVINRHLWDGAPAAEATAVVTTTAPVSTPLWSEPPGADGATAVGDLPLTPGERYPLLAIDAGEPDTTVTSAEAYRLWYQLALPDGGDGWVQAAVPSAAETGSDGRPSAVSLLWVMGDG